jgi:hypothetical protein
MHALFVQAAGLLQAAAEAQHGLLIEDGDGIARLAFENDEPDGIGAQIDNGTAW